MRQGFKFQAPCVRVFAVVARGGATYCSRFSVIPLNQVGIVGVNRSHVFSKMSLTGVAVLPASALDFRSSSSALSGNIGRVCFALMVYRILQT